MIDVVHFRSPLGPLESLAERANPVHAARYQYLTSREQNKLTPNSGAISQFGHGTPVVAPLSLDAG